jgi:hypothetical protein
MSQAFNLVRIIGVLALAAMLGACSAIKLGYNNLDDVAYWWLDSYLDFTDAQSPRVRADLAHLHLWHRSTELPRLADMLQRMEQMVAGEAAPAQACAFVAEIRERLDAAAERAEPAVVSLAMSLEPAQLQHLERKYRKNDTEYRKEWLELTPGEQKDKRFKQVIDRSEMIYGRLGDEQRAVVRQQLDQSVFDPRRILAERERRQQDALQTLRKVTAPGVSVAEARTLMRGYLERSQNSPDPAWRAYQDALIQEGCRSFAAAHAATTPSQRETAVRRLRAYQRDLRELAAQK